MCAVRQRRPHQEWITRAEDLVANTDFLRHVLHTVVAPTMLPVDPDLTVGWLREADAYCEGAGEPALQRRVRRTMAELGTRMPRSRAGAVPPSLARLGLTTREIEVLRMINAGTSNAEISDRLVISVRTVESHVSSMLAKTGKASRNDLPAVPR